MLAELALLDDGSVSLATLTRELGVSAATIRRDLADMEEQGLLVRTHGGARLQEAQPEVPVRLRDSRFRDAKQRIARRAAELLPDGPYSIALSGGTTTAEVVKVLATRPDLAIITNSLTTVMAIASRPNLKVIMTGGVVRSSSYEAVGVLAENTFNAINAGTAILGTDGISALGGATTHDETEARTNHAMIAHARDGRRRWLKGRAHHSREGRRPVRDPHPRHRRDGRSSRARAHRSRRHRDPRRPRVTPVQGP